MWGKKSNQAQIILQRRLLICLKMMSGGPFYIFHAMGQNQSPDLCSCKWNNFWFHLLLVDEEMLGYILREICLHIFKFKKNQLKFRLRHTHTKHQLFPVMRVCLQIWANRKQNDLKIGRKAAACYGVIMRNIWGGYQSPLSFLLFPLWPDTVWYII